LKVLVRFSDSRTVHIANYNVKHGTFKPYCNLYSPTDRIDIASGDEPSEDNVTCVQCVNNGLRD
jgi:hypothetical protein